MSKGHERLLRMMFYTAVVIFYCFYVTWYMLWYLFAPGHGGITIATLNIMAHIPIAILSLMFIWKRDVMKKDRLERKDGYAGFVKVVGQGGDNSTLSHPGEKGIEDEVYHAPKTGERDLEREKWESAQAHFSRIGQKPPENRERRGPAG